MKVEKVPSLVCENCGSFRVMMADEGPECEDCESSTQLNENNLIKDVEYLIYQLNRKEKEE